MVVLPAIGWSEAILLLLYVVVLWLPGGMIAAFGGFRGWSLAAGAPLLTYGVAGLGGPWTAALGIPWSVAALLAVTLLLASLVGVVRWLTGWPVTTTRPAGWTGRAALAVGACILLAAAVGFVAVAVGLRGLGTLPQGLDALFHANGIRWIAESGDGGLDGMTRVNWYGPAAGAFYPNGYHLVASGVYGLTGAPLPSVLNAHTAVLPAVAVLGIVALVRSSGGRAVLAGAVALALAAATPFYDLFAAGPILPYATGIALLPAAVALLLDVLDTTPARARRVSGIPLVLAAAGLLCIHPAALVTVMLFAVPALAFRWWTAPWTARADLPALGVLAAGTLALTVAQWSGLARASTGPGFDWPAALSPPEAVGQILLFGHNVRWPPWWLAALLLVGLLRFRRLDQLRWVAAPAAIFGALFVAAAAYDSGWADAITQPWWNDRFRLAGAATLALVVVAGLGLAEVPGLLVRTLRLDSWSPRSARRAVLLRAGVAAIVFGAFVGLSHGLYLARNEAVLRATVTDPLVSTAEVQAFGVLGVLVRPQDRVMNDRRDGSAWMYALAGVHPVAGHYVSDGVAPDAQLLAARFNAYDTDPAVRDAARRLGVRWVFVGSNPDGSRSTDVGLQGLDGVRALQRVYANPDVTIYRVVPG